ncbi:MAG TPA: TrbC/VirB2 family protein [Candidatus Saccharibacteria bacterium]|nr:TrbC/VirB2 family protein [Candidatus Saccharibacteria bacterium]
MTKITSDIKIVALFTAIGLSLLLAPDAFAASADVAKVEDFIRNVIKVIAGLAGLVATGFFVIGGFGYITSSGNPEDERMVLPLFSPYIEQGEISNLPSFSFYAKLSAVNSQEPLSGITLLLKDNGSKAVKNKVIKHSRKVFAKKQEETKTKEEKDNTETKNLPNSIKTDPNKTTPPDTMLEIESING